MEEIKPHLLHQKTNNKIKPRLKIDRVKNSEGSDENNERFTTVSLQMRKEELIENIGNSFEDIEDNEIPFQGIT
jgi:hypothetical protein